MFKLTYQAYIMFGMTMIYAIFRLLIIGKNKILKALAVIGLILFVWTCGYFGNSVHAWFGEVWKTSEYKGLNATAFLEPLDSADIFREIGLKKGSCIQSFIFRIRTGIRHDRSPDDHGMVRA